jgi:predicted RNase H-like HicB family nuclease
MKHPIAFSVTEYAEQALKQAEYCRDDNGAVVGKVPGASGFFAQGDSFEEARSNLREVVEGNIVLALQLGLPIPEMPGVRVVEHADAWRCPAQAAGGYPQTPFGLQSPILPP